MEIYTVHPYTSGSGIVYLASKDEVLQDECGWLRTWGSEKTALQWLRRNAQHGCAHYEVHRLDGSVLYLNYTPPPRYVLGKHEWAKANVMALADNRGSYDKLVCIHCNKVVRRYRHNRHFKEESECCEKHLVKL